MQELTSKRWRTTMLTLATLLGQQTMENPMPWYVVASAATVAVFYLVSQGLADQGKEKMKLYLAAIEKGVVSGKQLAEAVQEEVGNSSVEKTP